MENFKMETGYPCNKCNARNSCGRGEQHKRCMRYCSWFKKTWNQTIEMFKEHKGYEPKEKGGEGGMIDICVDDVKCEGIIAIKEGYRIDFTNDKDEKLILVLPEENFVDLYGKIERRWLEWLESEASEE